MSLNKTILIGRITKDLELKRTQSGISVLSFALAVNRRTQKQGQQETDFINCVAWNKTAELMERYLRKGSLIGIEGRIQTRSYDNQQGQKVYVTEVVIESVEFLESKGAQQNNQSNRAQYQEQQQAYNEFDMSGGNLDISNDDLPFN